LKHDTPVMGVMGVMTSSIGGRRAPHFYMGHNGGGSKNGRFHPLFIGCKYLH